MLFQIQIMPDSLMYQHDAYVVLETNQAEQLLTAEELLEKLKIVLTQRQDNLPPDVQRFTSIEEQSVYLLETSCELDIGAGEYLQWYAVRLEKP